MKFITTLLVATSLSAGFVAAEDKSIDVSCITGLQFDVTEIKLKVGEKLTVNFSNPDVMPHNFVVVKPGKGAEVGQAGLGAGPDKGYVPESDSVIAASKLLNKDETEEIEVSFDEAGTYPFICTFPGHYVIMKGSIIVE